MISLSFLASSSKDSCLDVVTVELLSNIAVKYKLKDDSKLQRNFYLRLLEMTIEQQLAQTVRSSFPRVMSIDLLPITGKPIKVSQKYSVHIS